MNIFVKVGFVVLSVRYVNRDGERDFNLPCRIVIFHDAAVFVQQRAPLGCLALALVFGQCFLEEGIDLVIHRGARVRRIGIVLNGNDPLGLLTRRGVHGGTLRLEDVFSLGVTLFLRGKLEGIIFVVSTRSSDFDWLFHCFYCLIIIHVIVTLTR